MTSTIRTDEEREEILKEIHEAWEALQAELAKMPADDLEQIRQELIEEIDEGIRQEAIRLQRQAS